MFWTAEPVSSGLVREPDHREGNLTGVTADDHQQTVFLAQLKDVVPGLDRFAILFNPSYAPVPGLLKYAEEGARALGLSTHLVKIAGREDLPAAFADMKRAGCRGALAINHGMFWRERATLARLAIENGIALSTPYVRNAEAGVLIGHEVDFDRVWRLNASYVGKVLGGARPGELPLVRLTTFRYGINLKTAKALGLTIPSSLLRSAAIVVPAADGIEEEIRRLEEERRQAVLKQDANTPEWLYADGMTTIDMGGDLHVNTNDAAARLNKPASRTTRKWDLEDIAVKAHDSSMAVALMKAHIEDTMAASPAMLMRA